MPPRPAGRSPRILVGLLCSLALGALPAAAESTRFYELEGFTHLLEGNPETTAVHEDGAVALPQAVHERLADASLVFSAATAWGDDVLVARADTGEVVAVDARGTQRPVFKSEEGVVTALLALGDVLWVATAAPARILEINRRGEHRVLHTAEAKFIWNMVPGPEASVLVTTGEPGTLLQLERGGRGKLLFKPEQAHLRALAYDPAAGILVGGAERGIVYRAANNRDFRALYDTGSPEITGILVRAGVVYVSAVTGAANLVDNDGKRQGKGEVQSQLVSLALDGSFELLAGSTDEAIFAIAAGRAGEILVATGANGREDPRGRLYRVDVQRRTIALIYQSPSRRLTHLVPMAAGKVALVAAAGGRIVDLSAALARSGEFFSAPFDAGINATFGLVQGLGHYPAGSEARIALRSGQTAIPDATWSPWSSEVTAPANRSTAVPPGRYLQARLQLRGNGQANPLVQRLRVAYRRQNLAPFVSEVAALPRDIVLQSLPRDESHSKIMAVGDKLEPRGNEDSRRNLRVRQSRERGALTVRWTADDLNGDVLAFDLFIRGVAETDWRLLKADLREPFYSMQSSQLPDGHYNFRVRVTDAPSNAPGQARLDTRDSLAVLVDNAPPTVAPLKVQVRGHDVQLQTRVGDALSALTELTYALDGGEPRPLLPVDGLLDGPEEVVEWRLDGLPSGRHTITLRLVDEASNEGFGAATFTIP